MPKQKTYKALSQRLRKKKKTILKLHSSHRHFLSKKSSKTKRYRKKRKEGLQKSDLKRIKKLI